MIKGLVGSEMCIRDSLGNSPFLELHLRLIGSAVNDDRIVFYAENFSYNAADSHDLISYGDISSHFSNLLILLLMRSVEKEPKRHKDQNQR